MAGIRETTPAGQVRILADALDAFVQMDISYRNEVPPSILSMDLRVLKGRSRLSD